MSEESKDAAKIAREDEIKTRRELRQRKILENAKNRLEKLNGRPSESSLNGDVSRTKSPVVYPDPEIEQELFDNLTFSHEPPMMQQSAPFNMNSPENMFNLLEQLTQMQGSLGGGSGRSTMTTTTTASADKSMPQSQQATTSQSLLTKLIRTKLHIATISAITYILFVTGNEQFVSYSVFLPLLLWEILEIFLLKSYETPATSFLIQILVLLTAVPPNHLIAITKMLNTLNKILKDVGVFVFFFTLYHLVYFTFIRSRDWNEMFAG